MKRVVFFLSILLALCSCFGAPDDDAKSSPVIDFATVDGRVSCDENMYEEADNQMCTNAGRPHTYSLRQSLIFKFIAEWSAPFCRPHPNTNSEKQTIGHVQSCCVRPCLLEVRELNKEYRVGYFLSGTKTLNEDGEIPGARKEDEECGDCWGAITMRRNYADAIFGSLCKRGESWLARFSLAPTDGKNSSEELLALEKLPLCVDAEFESANGSLVKAPLHLTNASSTTVCTGSSAAPGPSESPESQEKGCAKKEIEADAKDGKKVWDWLGPAAIGLVGTFVIGICGIVGMKFQRSVIIKTDKNNSTESDDTVGENGKAEIFEI